MIIFDIFLDGVLLAIVCTLHKDFLYVQYDLCPDQPVGLGSTSDMIPNWLPTRENWTK